MAGTPILNAFSAEVERQGGDNVILDRVAAGESLQSIVNDYQHIKVALVGDIIYRWVKRGGDKRKEAYRHARKSSADRLVDKATEVLEAPYTSSVPQPAEVAHRKSLATHYTWMAS